MISKIERFLISLLLIHLISTNTVNAVNDSVLQNIENRLTDFYHKYPHQKAYLHIDKNNYRAGENIWFKAYLLDAFNHSFDSASTNLYVELVNGLNQTVEVKILKMKEGTASGNFNLADTLETGFYRIYAYTSFMRNFDQHLMFKKEVLIENNINYVVRKKYNEYKKKNKEALNKQNSIVLNFYPEGGDLVNGLNTNMACKITNGLGNPIEAEGIIKDNEGKVVVEFKSNGNGTGVFAFQPDVNKNYTAYLKNDLNKNYPLPKIKENGIVLNIKNEKDKITCTISSARPDNNVYLIGHARGKVCFSEKINISGFSEKIEIHPNHFPTGVAHFTVFNADQKPEAERLVFINNKNLPTVAVMRYDRGNTSKDSLQYVVRTTGSDQKPIISNLSVNVTESGAEQQENESMLTYLLLNSDISGKIGNPDQYFNNSDESATKLDLLMMVQDWRRFKWNDVLENDKNKGDLKYEVENGISLKGKVERDDFKSSYADIIISLTLHFDEDREIIVGKTDGTGEFIFQNLDYFGEIDARIDAKESDFGKSMNIVLEKYNSPDFNDHIYKPIDLSGFKIKRPLQTNSSGSNKSSGAIYGVPDYTLHFDENLRASLKTYVNIFS